MLNSPTTVSINSWKKEIRTIRIMLVIAIVAPFFLLQANATEIPDHRGLCSDKIYRNKIRNIWQNRKPVYYEWIKGDGSESDGFQRNHPYELYDIQIETNNLLRFCEYCRELDVLEELISLYLLALDTLKETDQYTFYYLPNSPRQSIQELSKKHTMWLDGQKRVGKEIILVSSQFLYLVSDAIIVITNIEQVQRTPSMQAFVSKFLPILLDHYKRWLFDEIGPFQVRGWGCKVGGKYIATGMNHLEFITKKLKRKLGDEDSPGYCNAVTDSDMWIIAGVSNILTAHKKDSRIVPISSEDFKRFITYLTTGIELLSSRITYTLLEDFEGKALEGANFDLGAWDDHPTYAYTGYSSEEYPDFYSIIFKRQQSGVGWDLSHARRFVHVFEALFRNKELLDLEFPTKSLMEKLANQLIYGAFNRDIKKPLFTNFMDGTNGWFRVGYSGRAGFGYGPWDMSIAVLTGGYGYWAKHNKDVEAVFCALRNMLESNEPKVRKHVIEHYENNYWRYYKRPRKFNFEDKENPNTQSILIQFLPSLCKISTYQECYTDESNH